ncbi:MAG: Uma2 family endonuclease [Lacipirellulaceae bacterium]
MTSLLDNPAVRAEARLLTVAEYHRLGELGVLDRKTELLQGVLVRKMTISPLHSFVVQQLVDVLRRGVGPGWLVRQEQPLTLRDSEPEPDVLVTRGEPADFRRSHPTTAALAIEVAVSSEGFDRAKIGLYAEAGVPECWLVLCEDLAIERHTNPRAAAYESVERLVGDANLSPRDFPDAQVSLRGLFGFD